MKSSQLKSSSTVPSIYSAPSRPTQATIDLGRLRQNARAIRRAIGPTVKLMTVVKAQAYGHGLIPVSVALEEEAAVDWLGVGTVDEAAVLRQQGIRKPILILSTILPAEAPTVVSLGVSQTVCSAPVMDALAREAKKRQVAAPVHLKVDTGMGRIGIWWEQALDLIQKIRRHRSLRLEGLMTHLSCADRPSHSLTRLQLSRFNQVLDACRRAGITIPWVHAANSAGVLLHPDSHFNLVRPGLLIYGILPGTLRRHAIDVQPVMSLKSRIVFLRRVPKGRTISYGAQFVTRRATQLAMVPIGYGDGFSRRMSGKAKVLIRGRLAPVVGTITMDQIVVDVGCVPGVRVGDPVTLIGKQRSRSITASDLACWSDTIPYEVMTCVTNRVTREYKE